MAMYPNLSLHQLLPSGVSSMSRRKPVCILHAQSRVKMFVSVCQLKWFCFLIKSKNCFYYLMHDIHSIHTHIKSNTITCQVKCGRYPRCPSDKQVAGLIPAPPPPICPSSWERLWTQLHKLLLLLYLVNPNELVANCQLTSEYELWE